MKNLLRAAPRSSSEYSLIMAKDAVPTREDCNPLCARCVRRCRQPAAVRLLECPRFRPFPFRIEKNRFEQLDLFAPPPPHKD